MLLCDPPSIITSICHTYILKVVSPSKDAPIMNIINDVLCLYKTHRYNLHCEKNEMVLGRAYQPPQRRPMDLARHHLETT